MRFNTLNAWLDWQAALNPAEIELGLERIEQVLSDMGISDRFDCPLIMVAGTNGKGSVVSMIESIALAEGLDVACYTSPHIQRYNERIRFNAEEVSDEALCDAFERIDDARAGRQLTYFEFGTLAAIDLFHRSSLDLIVMEVGLGGRLDAVNVMHPDVSVITTIDIDHTDWLGENREIIGAEKAGIFRSATPAVCGDLDPPRSIRDRAESLATHCYFNGVDFHVEKSAGYWKLTGDDFEVGQLPPPSLQGEVQFQNAAVSIMAVSLLKESINISEQSIRKGLMNIELSGRYQLIHKKTDVFVDVAHNVQAAKALADQLTETNDQYNQTHAVIAMLADKDVESVIAQLGSNIDVWHCAGLDAVPRGMPVKRIVSLLEQANTGVKLRAEPTVEMACLSAIQETKAADRIIVFGSFYTVSEAMTYFENRASR